MRRPKPLSIYPPPDLRGRITVLAERRGRSLNQQVIRFLTRAVERAERAEQRRQMDRAQTA